MFINFRPLQIICFFEQYALKTGKIKGRWDADLTIKFVSPGTIIVSTGRMNQEKRGTTLDFLMKVIIVVCTLVKVYNMKKKTELIVTVVSITSLYF